MYELLSPDLASAYFSRQLERDEEFSRFLVHYRERGFEFFPERVQLTIALPDEGEAGEPFVLAIVPSFAPTAMQDEGHEAASIVTLRTRGVSTVLAGEVSVGHEPFRVRSFRLVLPDKEGRPAVRAEVTREQTMEEDVRLLAERLGPAEFPHAELVDDVQGLDAHDVGALSADVYRRLLQDSFAPSGYPAYGLASLREDEPLVSRWATLTRDLFTEAGGRPAAKARAIHACCSTSTSCNACSSTSSSCVKL